MNRFEKALEIADKRAKRSSLFSLKNLAILAGVGVAFYIIREQLKAKRNAAKQEPESPIGEAYKSPEIKREQQAEKAQEFTKSGAPKKMWGEGYL